MLHENCATDLDFVIDKCKTFIAGSTEIQDAFCKQQDDHLIIGVNEARFVLRRASEMAEHDPASGLYSLEELFKKSIRKPEPVIQDLLYEGETMLVAGRPKVGKSRIVHQMTLSLSNGIPFLSMNVAQARRVLLIDLENRPWAIRDRFMRMSAEKGLKNKNVFVWSADTLADNAIDSSESGIKRLETLLHETHADILIIDPWRLWLGKDENNAEEVVRGLKVLTALRRNRPSLAIVIVHHVRKERFESPAKLMRDPSLWVENISGHYALVGHVDCCYGLERQEQDGEEVVIFGGIARNVESRTILLTDDPESLRFDVANTEESAKLAMTEREKELWEKAKKKRQFTWSDFFGLAGTTNKKLISSMLKKAESHRLIEKTERGYKIIVSG
jgi:hypothetical protein